MNSKEALDNLHRCALTYQATDKDKWIKHCRKVRNIVDKDLDRLEILKKHIYIMGEVKAGDTIISQSLGMSLDSRVNDNDFKKIKEWLINE